MKNEEVIGEHYNFLMLEKPLGPDRRRVNLLLRAGVAQTEPRETSVDIRRDGGGRIYQSYL